MFAVRALLFAARQARPVVENAMSNTKQLFEPPPQQEQIRLGGGVLWAARNALGARGTAWSVLITVAVSLPLYVIGYHEGAFPIVGFWLALVLGAVAAGASMGVMVASLLGKSRGLALTAVACQLRWMRPFTLTFAVAVPLMILTWRYVAAPATNIELLNGWFQNEWASVWKPLAQVTAIAVLQLTLAPFAALAVPALAVAGGSRLETVQWMKHRLHHKTYDALALGYWGMTLGVLAFVPWVGLLALPVMCLLLVRVFHLTFARREEWPSTDESGA